MRIWLTYIIFTFLSTNIFCNAAESVGMLSQVTLASVRTLDQNGLPSDRSRLRSKWSNQFLVLTDGNPVTPAFYTYDRAGKSASSALMLEISDAAHVFVNDFGAAPDGSVWVCGSAHSRDGRPAFFLAHLSPDGSQVKVIRTTPYYPHMVGVSPDGTVWTVGHAENFNAAGDIAGEDPDPNLVRHFDGSGILVASAISLRQLDMRLLRVFSGFLVANSDRIGWYSPGSGHGKYVELSEDMKVLNSYPVAPTGTLGIATGFALTSAGTATVVIAHSKNASTGATSALYELDRDTRTWIPVNGVPQDAPGHIPSLKGNDGNSLIFSGADPSKLQVLEISQSAGR